MTKEINLSEVFSVKMIEDAMECKDTKEIQSRVIEPNMAHINKVTGQENNPTYWAYAMEYVLTWFSEGGDKK
jgi:hypothetical protein